MNSIPYNLTLEDNMLIMQFLETLSDEIWRIHQHELLQKLNQFSHTQILNVEDDPFEDEIPF